MAAATNVTHDIVGDIHRIVVDWTAAADGSILDALLPVIEGTLFEIHTIPGSPAPTDNYDVTIVDADSIDRLQGVGLNRDTAVTESVPVVFSGGSTVHPVVSRNDILTMKFAGNAVDSAEGRVLLIYGRV